MAIPPEGKYICKLNGQVVIYQASTGSICAAVPSEMVDTGFKFKHTMLLVKADGPIMTKATDTLKAVFGWDGADPFWLMDNSIDGGSMRTAEFEIVGGPETGDKGGQYFKSQWLNPLGSGMKSPTPADRETVMSKYGKKFAALASSGKSPGPAPKVPVVPKAAPITQPAAAPAATMEEAWRVLNEANVGKDAADIEKIWFDTIGKMFPNKSNTDLKPHEWGKLKVEFTDYIQM